MDSQPDIDALGDATGTAVDQARYCLSCDYDLRGTDGGRCPECGRPFNLERPSTFARIPRARRRRPVWVAILFPPVALGLTYLLGWGLGLQGFILLLLAAGAIALGTCAILLTRRING